MYLKKKGIDVLLIDECVSFISLSEVNERVCFFPTLRPCPLNREMMALWRRVHFVVVIVSALVHSFFHFVSSLLFFLTIGVTCDRSKADKHETDNFLKLT